PPSEARAAQLRAPPPTGDGQLDLPAIAPPATASAPAVLRSKQYKLADRATRPENTVIRVGDLLIGESSFVVMAGPCSVESKPQIDATARPGREHGAHRPPGGGVKPPARPAPVHGPGGSRGQRAP